MFVDTFIIIVTVITFLSLFDDDKEEKGALVTWMYVLVVSLLVLMTAFRPIGIDKDSMTYLAYYEGAGSDSIVDLIEPSFTIISAFSGMLGEARILFVIYALLAIPIMAYGLTRLTRLWFLSLLIWVAHYFLIQDMTQIRVAVSTGLFVFSLKYLKEGKRWKYLGYMIVAIFFHFSAVLLTPFTLLSVKKELTVGYRVILGALPFLFYTFYVRGVDILTYIPIPFFQERREVYETLRDRGVAGDDINVFNAYALIRLFCFLLLLWKYEVVAQKFKGLSVLLKIQCFSICFYAAFAFLPALSMRGSEVCGVVDILLIPCLAYTVKPMWLSKSLVALFGVILFLYNIYVSEYLQLTM